MSSNVLNIVAIGDHTAGKTALLTTYAENKYPDYIPTVFDHYRCNITVDGRNFFIELRDTSGLENYELLRPVTCLKMNCCLLCYSIEDRISFDNVLTKWYPELKRLSPDTPFILVGTKLHLRERNCDKYVTRTEAKKMKQKIGAFSLVECSAEHNENISKIIDEAIRSTIKKTNTESRCSIS